MGGIFGLWQWVIVLVIILLLFGGGGKLSRIMGDFGRGLRSLKNNLSGEEEITEKIEEDKQSKTKK